MKKIIINFFRRHSGYHNLETDFQILEDGFNDLVDENTVLKATNEYLESKLRDPREAIQYLLNKDLGWFDFEKIEEPTARQNYFREVQSLLKNVALKNEINFLINNFTKESMWGAEDDKTTNDIRLQALTLDLFIKRLESIPAPDQKDEEPTEPYSAV